MNAQSLRRIVVASVLAVTIAVALPHVLFAYAYTFTIGNSTSQTINRIHLHTVSAFCANKDWSGAWTANQGALTLNDQSACLVDAITATDTNGKTYSWSSPIGVTSSTWTIDNTNFTIH